MIQRPMARHAGPHQAAKKTLSIKTTMSVISRFIRYLTLGHVGLGGTCNAFELDFCSVYAVTIILGDDRVDGKGSHLISEHAAASGY